MTALMPLFCHRCDVFIVKKEIDSFGKVKEELVLDEENIPCRLRYLQQSPAYASPPLKKANGKLYLPPTYSIQAGSHLIVYLKKQERYYKTGMEAQYDTHNEVLLTYIKNWM